MGYEKREAVDKNIREEMKKAGFKNILQSSIQQADNEGEDVMKFKKKEESPPIGKSKIIKTSEKTKTQEKPKGIGEQYLEKHSELLKEEKEKTDLLLEANKKIYNAIENSINKSIELIEDLSKKLETQYAKIEEAVSKELLKPPDIKEIETPKNWIELFAKTIAPAIVGLSALFRNDKFANYNYFYFNSMMQSLKQNDLETYQKLLNQWKVDFEYAVMRKENEIKVAELQLNKLIQTHSLKDKALNLQIKLLEQHIKQNNDVIENIQKHYEKLNKALLSGYNLKIKEAELQVQRERNALIKSKSSDLEDAVKLALQIAKTKLTQLGSSLTREQLENAIKTALDAKGIKLSKEKEDELVERFIDAFMAEEEIQVQPKEKSWIKKLWQLH